MAAKVILVTKEWTGMASAGCTNEAKSNQLSKICLGLESSFYSKHFEKSWTFSIAMDVCTHMSTSYLDI